MNAWMIRLLESVKRRLEIKRAFQKTFDRKDRSVQLVLAAMANFCRSDAAEGCGRPIDPYRLALNAGRRQAYEYLLAQMNITQQDLDEMELGGSEEDEEIY
ncbi:MAG: hypothetical protein ACI37O_04320 [Candidatus Avelusimicrobium sp.]|uniref:Bbp19 family protein n=1 Tax=Candidatus Avelusimicrobium sp. TaxID=3048833 RepID=UPI003EFCED88